MIFIPLFSLLIELMDPPSTTTVQTAQADRYFITIFGAQSVPYRGRHTHTWATFVKTSGNQPVDVQTIS